MIKAILNWFFRKEIEAIKAETSANGRALIEKIKRESKRIYVSYEHIPEDAELFLYGIQPLFNNRYFISWLNRHRNECIDLTKKNCVIANDKGVMEAAAQLAIVDLILDDVREFEQRYRIMLEEKEYERKQVE